MRNIGPFVMKLILAMIISQVWLYEIFILIKDHFRRRDNLTRFRTPILDVVRKPTDLEQMPDCPLLFVHEANTICDFIPDIHTP